MPKISVRALQLNTEGLIKLLGGTSSDRERFWEILKGITTPQQAILVNQQIAELAGVLSQAKLGATALTKSVKASAR